MNKIMAMAGLISLMMFGCGVSQAEQAEKVGSLVTIPLNDPPSTIEAKVGDLLQFDLGFAVIPDELLSDLKINIQGKGLTHVATTFVPKRADKGQVVVGAMQISGFVRADAAGTFEVKIIPRHSGGKKGKETKITVKVAK
jgi:hypothetical protein